MKTLLAILLGCVAISFAAAGTATQISASGVASGDTPCALIPSYEKISAALAGDDLEAARAGAKDLACWAGQAGQVELRDQVAQLESSDSLEEARNHFKAVSATVIPLAETAGPHFVMTCPMAQADWIQTDATIANPYYGSEMLRCGAIKRTVKAGGE